MLLTIMERRGVNEVLTRSHRAVDAFSKKQECNYMASYSTHLPKWSVYGSPIRKQDLCFLHLS